MNISLDGYCDHTLGEPSEELMDYFTWLMDDVDLLFYGRVMYQLMFPYWADVAKDRPGLPLKSDSQKGLSQLIRWWYHDLWKLATAKLRSSGMTRQLNYGN